MKLTEDLLNLPNDQWMYSFSINNNNISLSTIYTLLEWTIKISNTSNEFNKHFPSFNYKIWRIINFLTDLLLQFSLSSSLSKQLVMVLFYYIINRI